MTHPKIGIYDEKKGEWIPLKTDEETTTPETTTPETTTPETTTPETTTPETTDGEQATPQADEPAKNI